MFSSLIMVSFFAVGQGDDPESDDPMCSQLNEDIITAETCEKGKYFFLLCPKKCTAILEAARKKKEAEKECLRAEKKKLQLRAEKKELPRSEGSQFKDHWIKKKLQLRAEKKELPRSEGSQFKDHWICADFEAAKSEKDAQKYCKKYKIIATKCCAEKCTPLLAHGEAADISAGKDKCVRTTGNAEFTCADTFICNKAGTQDHNKTNETSTCVDPAHVVADTISAANQKLICISGTRAFKCKAGDTCTRDGDDVKVDVCRECPAGYEKKEGTTERTSALHTHYKGVVGLDACKDECTLNEKCRSFMHHVSEICILYEFPEPVDEHQSPGWIFCQKDASATSLKQRTQSFLAIDEA